MIHLYIATATTILGIMTWMGLNRHLYTKNWERIGMEFAQNIFFAIAVAWWIGLAVIQYFLISIYLA
jgi:hypothetical protein